MTARKSKLSPSEKMRRNSDERWVFAAIACTFGFYFVGALYLIAPVLGWVMLSQLLARRQFQPAPFDQNSNLYVILWAGSAVGLLVALIVGHVSYDLGIGKIIKSTVGWAKGWALLSVFILIGLYSHIRAAVIIRGACVVGFIALLLTPILVIAWLIGLPDKLYVSPLKVLGGSGPEYFTVILYEIDPGNGAPRWRFFAPWAPAVGFVANIYLLCAFYERRLFWRIVGVTGNALMILLAASRMGVLVMLTVPTAVFFMSRIFRPGVLVIGLIVTLLVAGNFERITDTATNVITQIKEARADSTRVRSALNEIAHYRWETEAPWFGHGIVESGSHLVEFMPIGSHHNWFGLLFVKGTVGFLSFCIPFLMTGLALLIRAQIDRTSRIGLGAFLIVSFFSFSENLEALAYLTWPAWLLIGLALRQPLRELNWNLLVVESITAKMKQVTA